MTTIRTAKVSDATSLADLAEGTFRDTFSELNSSEDMDLHCQTNFGEAIQAEEISNRELVTLVAETNDGLVAYAQLRWSEPPSCIRADSPSEILRLYVDKKWHGKGLAHELMRACLHLMEERKTDIAWLGVWENNPRAISFYKKFAFREVGDHIFTLGKDAQRDIIMARPIR